VLQCVATVSSPLNLLYVLQRVAVYVSVLQCVATVSSPLNLLHVLQRVAVYVTVLQCVAECGYCQLPT